jgi:hypothetical protein
MKRIILLFFLLMNQLFVFAQNDAINRFAYPPRNIDYNDCIKSITNYNYSFKRNKETVDTVKTINKIQFNKKGIITKQWNFNKSIEDPWQIIEHDNKGRILTISRKNKDKISLFAKQFFNNFSEYPDSLNIYRGKKSKTDQYINHFNKKLLVKQEYYTQDTLRHYNTYQYDKKSRLIKESFINTENGWGITIGKSITGNKDEKTLNSNDYTTYDYNKFKDTMVITKTKFTPKHTYKEIKKELKSNNYLFEVKEEYDNDYLHQSTHTYTSKDSIFNCTYYYKNKKEISRFYKTITTPTSIVSNWNSDINKDKESIQTTNIEIELDKFNNWTKKTYFTNNIITELITREIEYSCH